jgi:hypothetical protein
MGLSELFSLHRTLQTEMWNTSLFRAGFETTIPEFEWSGTLRELHFIAISFQFGGSQLLDA